MKINNKNIIGIDASNLSGGGLTHIAEILKVSNPNNNNFEKIIIWGSQKTFDRIIDRDWIIKISHPLLEKNFFFRTWWQWKELSKMANRKNCSVLFIPGGYFFSRFNPVVSMSQNILPFKWNELKRFGFALFTIKLLILYFVQSVSFRKANGLIFLTKYARETILAKTGLKGNNSIIIPHGIGKRFFNEPRKQKPISEYGSSNPFRLTYISSVMPYKNQSNVIKAVCKLIKNKIPVSLDMYGPSDQAMRDKLNIFIKSCEFSRGCINYHGPVKNDDIHKLYISSDISIFASSCENLPIILLESMASGTPIACSNVEPMPSILRDAGSYFDPFEVDSIYAALFELINNSSLRESNSIKSYKIANEYSWEKCANDTFKYLTEM